MLATVGEGSAAQGWCPNLFDFSKIFDFLKVSKKCPNGPESFSNASESCFYVLLSCRKSLLGDLERSSDDTRYSGSRSGTFKNFNFSKICDFFESAQKLSKWSRKRLKCNKKCVFSSCPRSLFGDLEKSSDYNS